MRQRRAPGPWRQDDLEPRIILDGDGEFFAIGASGFEAARIVASLNRTEPPAIDSPGRGVDARKIDSQTPDH